jgi:hypothetical protein
MVILATVRRRDEPFINRDDCADPWLFLRFFLGPVAFPRFLNRPAHRAIVIQVFRHVSHSKLTR